MPTTPTTTPAPAAQPTDPTLGAIAPFAGAATAPAAAALVGGALDAKAAAAIAKQTTAAMLSFARKQEGGMQAVALATLQAAHPHVPTRDLGKYLRPEPEFRRTYLRKLSLRLATDLPKILGITDPVERKAQFDALIARERRFAMQREEAMSSRALARFEAALLKSSSPEGAYWKLSDSVQNHTLDCLAMANKFWPWSVLNTEGPPRHAGCPCYLLGKSEAIEAGLMRADQVPDPKDAPRLAARLLKDAEDAEDLKEAEADLVALEEAVHHPVLHDSRQLLRWAAGYEHGGEFRPKAGGNPGARLMRELGLRGRGDGHIPTLADNHLSRWTWIRGRYTRIPVGENWGRTEGGVHYSSPAGSPNVYRDGKLMSEPGATFHPDALPGSPPGSPGVPTGIQQQLDMLRDTRREPYRRRAAAAARQPRQGQPPIEVGDGPDALGALEDGGFVLDKSSPGGMGKSVLSYHSRQVPAARLKISWNGHKVEKVNWDALVGQSPVKRKVLGHPPRSWREYVQDGLGWADELGLQFNAPVSVPAIQVDGDLRDHAGRHEWSGEVEVGTSTPVDILAAGRRRRQGEPLTDAEKEGVYASTWVAAHEIAHGVNPIEPTTFADSAHANLEEALAEELSHPLAAAHLKAQGQDDVLEWAKAHPDALPVRGNYMPWRNGLRKLLHDAGITSPEDRMAALERLKFLTPPDKRFDVLAGMLANHDKSHTVDEWHDHAYMTMDNGEGDEEFGHPVLSPHEALMPHSPGEDVAPPESPGDLGDGKPLPGAKSYEGEDLFVGSPVWWPNLDKTPAGRGYVVSGSHDGYVTIRQPSGDMFELWAGDVSRGDPPKDYADDEFADEPQTLWSKLKGWHNGFSSDSLGGPLPPLKSVTPTPPPPPEFIGGDQTGPVTPGLIPTYDHVRLELGKNAGGSTGARWAFDKDNSRWLVKRYNGNVDRVATEALANAIYREMGAKVANAGLITAGVSKDPDFTAIPDTPLDEPPIPVKPGQRVSSGIIIRKPDGRMVIFEPLNHFGGYEHSFPKGGVEPGLTPQQNAHKELWEETGLHARITGVLGDYQGDTGVTRYYVGVQTGGKPTPGDETAAVKTVTPDEAASMLNKARDKQVLADLLAKTSPPASDEKYDDVWPMRSAVALTYPTLDGEPKKITTPSSDIGQHFMTDALLANWDFIGLTDDNVMWGEDGKPFRVDQGGTFFYRAQGEPKPYGPVPTEVWTMLGPKGQGFGKVAVSDEAKRSQARAIAAKLSPARIDKLVDAAPFRDEKLREDIRENLKARVAWMADYGAGKVDEPRPLEGEHARTAVERAQGTISPYPEQEGALGHFLAHEAEINDALRKGVPKDKVDEPTRASVKELDGLLRATGKTDDDLVLQKPIDVPEDKLADPQLGGLVGQTLSDKGFLTASFDPPTEAEAGDAVLRITVPAGERIIHADGWPNVAVGGGDVAIMGRGRRVRIVGRTRKGGQTYVDAVLLPDNQWAWTQKPAKKPVPPAPPAA